MPIANRNLFLVGPRACGKTTLGKRLAERLGADFVDADHLLVEREGRAIADIVAERGWDAFRDVESDVLRSLCEDIPSGGRVVATGGGVALRPDNRELLASGVVVYLRSDAPTLVSRLCANPLEAQRPSLTGLPLAEEVERTLAERDPLYRERAQLVVDASRPLNRTEDEILAFLDPK